MNECRFNGLCLLTEEFMVDCDGHGTTDAGRCEDYKPMPDAHILLALADEIDRSALELLKTNGLDPNWKRQHMRIEHAQDLMAAVSRIREALGVCDGR